MQNPSSENQKWWNTFHFAHGLASGQEQAFLGYLVTQHIDVATLSAAQLDTHWANFQAWWTASQTT